LNDNSFLAYAILNRELERLNDRSAAEGLAGGDLKTLETIIKAYKLLQEQPLSDKVVESKPLILTDSALLKVLTDDDNDN
jgi:hypothetical protein